MLSASIFIPVGFMSTHCDANLKKMAVVALAYVLIYSFLPHKELRFIIYVFPVLNLMASTGVLEMYVFLLMISH